MKKRICLTATAVICISVLVLIYFLISPNFVWGDIDQDKSVTQKDAKIMQQYLVCMENLSDSQLTSGDVNRDTNVNICDVTVIQQYISGAISSVPLIPDKVNNVKAETISDTEIRISWSEIAGAKKYYVYVNDVLYDSTTKDNLIVKNRTPDTVYQVYVTASLENKIQLNGSNADIIFAIASSDPSVVIDQSSPNDTDLMITASKIKEYQNSNTLTLSFMSDTHFDFSDTDYSRQKIKTYEKFGKLQNYVGIDFAANLGDIINGKSPKAETVEHIKALTGYMSEYCQCPLYFLRGNHDDNGWYSYGNYGGSFKTDEMLNETEWYNLAVKNYSSQITADPSNPYGGYGYYDHEKSKIRIFLLNTSDIPYIKESDGTYRYNSYVDLCISNAQLNFVANSLLFSDKESPDEWAALFISHVPLDISDADGEKFSGALSLPKGSNYLLSIINAYKSGTSFKGSGSTKDRDHNLPEDFMVNVNIDYSQKGKGEVIAFFSGHTHTDNFCNIVGGEGSLSYGFNYIGVSGSTSFANFIIDRDKKIISAVKYGQSIEETYKGTLVSKPDIGTIKSGEWSVYY